jgi:hypothetical protein
VPIPRNDHSASWRSIVYLHGRLGQLNQQLVLNSADFGRAYLTEGWAARFVSRLFSDFTVLFIGYSLNDPVLRYMTDAFAAEDAEARFGRRHGPAYIFYPYDGSTTPSAQSFRDRNLEPIFYSSSRRHIALRDTLVAWASWREDYLTNIRQLIADIAPRLPTSIDPTDTANLTWAVIGRPDDQGSGARAFSLLEPRPPIEWLDAFQAHEVRLEERHAADRDEANAAGRLPPNSPILHIAPLFPSALDQRELNLTRQSQALVNWLVRHLSNEAFVERILHLLANGRRPHILLRKAIREHLAGEHSLRHGFVVFWRLVSREADWVIGTRHPTAVVGLMTRRIRDDDLATWWFRHEVLAALRPSLILSQSSYRAYREAISPSSDSDPVGDRFSQIVQARITLFAGDYIQTIIDSINRRSNATEFWGSIADELTSTLLQVFRLYDEVDAANPDDDRSIWDRPSIVPHHQNRHHRTWTTLFDLIWRGWLYLDQTNSDLSRAMVRRWRHLPYLAFRRLTAAAMNHSSNFTADEKLTALLDG